MKQFHFIIAITLMVLMDASGKTNESSPLPVQSQSCFILPGSNRQVPKNLLEARHVNSKQDTPAIRFKHRPSTFTPYTNIDLETLLLWDIGHTDDNAEYFLNSGAAEDTFAVVFSPPQNCVVSEVYVQWMTTGNVSAFAADYNDSAAAISPDGECSMILSGNFAHSPIGRMRTPITSNTIDAYVADWSYQLDVGGTFVVGDSSDLSYVPPFVIGVVKGGEDPKPLANATVDLGNITYTWFGGPSTNGLWGSYSDQVELMMLVRVEYGWTPPIIIHSLTQLNDTYNLQGPFTVEADLWDGVVNGVAIDSTDHIVFHWTLNGGAEATGSLTADEVGPDGNGWYAYDITGTFESGDRIEYWITAVDNDNLASESIHLSFNITEPGHPDADLLIVYEGSAHSQIANTHYENVANNQGIVFEYWNVRDNNGIDASIINAGWSNIVVYGWGTTIVPAVTGESDPGFATFLDNGGNLLYADQDWYFSHGLPPEITFEQGDFAYDYFGIGSAINDLVDDDNISIADTAFYGIGGTAIDVEFTETPLVLNHSIYGTKNWGDPVVAGNATAIFAGAEDGLTYGVSYDQGTFKTAYFGFMPDAAVDSLDNGTLTSDQFDTFFTAALEWMGVSSPPQVTEVFGPTGVLISGPYPVSATIVDAQGDSITAKVLISSDDGNSWTEIAMTADGDRYSAVIPNVTESGMYYWLIEATSAGATSIYPVANQAPMVFERFVPMYPTLVLFNGLPTVGFPSDYYFAHSDLQYDVWGKKLTADLASNYISILEIATNGPDYDQRAVITSWLAEGPKNYMLAGDEWFGVLTGWSDRDYVAGEFEYDVLGIAHIYHDINISSTLGTAIEAVSGNPISGPLFNTHMANGDTLMYDPFHEIEVSNWLDGFEPINATDVNMRTFGDSSIAIGLNREVDDDKIIFWGFDPMSINAVPYTWYSYTADAPAAMAIPWFGILSSDVVTSSLPTEFSLAKNYPNPFNPTTTISFEIPSESDVTIGVYNMLGQKVVDLVNDSFAPGVYAVQWNGVDSNGKPVGSGLYIYQMNAGQYSAASKMLYLK